MRAMTTNKLRPAIGASVLALFLVACGEAPQPEPAAPPPAPAETPAPADEAVPAPSEEAPPADAAEPAPSPAPEPPPPTEPSPVPKPTATAMEPSLDSMRVAIPGAKISVPVELRYQVDGDALAGRPVTVHLAAIPRVAGAKLHVELKSAPGLQVAAKPLDVQKASAKTAYRQQLSVTRSGAGPDHLRVLVTMEMAEGLAFGYYTVPLASGITAQKQESVKQR
jgi:hypothetical protein